MNFPRPSIRTLYLRQGRLSPFNVHPTVRHLSTYRPLRQAHHAPDEQPVNFYRSHGRALFKALTLAFLSYQIVYYVWLTLETEELKDHKDQKIQSLETQVRLLDDARRNQPPS